MGEVLLVADSAGSLRVLSPAGDLRDRGRRLAAGRHRSRPSQPGGAGVALDRRCAGQRAGRRSGDEPRRTVRRVRVGGIEPRRRRHQQSARHLRARPPAPDDHSGQRLVVRRPGARKHDGARWTAGFLLAGAERQRPLRALPVFGHQPRRRRHQRPRGPVPPRPGRGRRLPVRRAGTGVDAPRLGRERWSEATCRVAPSLAASSRVRRPAHGARLSRDGRHIVFSSPPRVRGRRHQRAVGHLRARQRAGPDDAAEPPSRWGAGGGNARTPIISATGRIVAFTTADPGMAATTRTASTMCSPSIATLTATASSTSSCRRSRTSVSGRVARSTPRLLPARDQRGRALGWRTRRIRRWGSSICRLATTRSSVT